MVSGNMDMNGGLGKTSCSADTGTKALLKGVEELIMASGEAEAVLL